MSRAEVTIFMDRMGMGGILTIGWMLLAAYLAILLVVSFSLIAYDFVRSKLRLISGWLNPLTVTQEVEHS
jgi:hypothetical protein